MRQLWDILRFVIEFWPLLLLVAVSFPVHRLFGWRGVGLLWTAGLASLIYRKGVSDERERTEQEQARKRSEAIEARRKVDSQVNQMDPASARDRLGKWLRNDKR